MPEVEEEMKAPQATPSVEFDSPPPPKRRSRPAPRPGEGGSREGAGTPAWTAQSYLQPVVKERSQSALAWPSNLPPTPLS